MSMMKLLDEIVEDFEQSLDDCNIKVDKGFNLREEVEGLEREIEVIKGQIEAKKQEALDLGYAEMAIDPNYTPQKRVPDKAKYIELHGQEAFDRNHMLTKARPRFTWID